MESNWHIRFSQGTIIIYYNCGIHKNIEYKNLKKLEAHLIDVFPGYRFSLDYIFPKLIIRGDIRPDDIEKIEKVIRKNKFCKPATTYRATKSGSPDMVHRHWNITQPLIIFQRRKRLQTSC